MKKSKFFLFLLILVLSVSVVSPLTVSGVEYQNEPNSIPNRVIEVFMGGYFTACIVPFEIWATYTTPSGRTYRGFIPRASNPMLTNQGGWGAVFRGTVFFIGISRGYTEADFSFEVDFPVPWDDVFVGIEFHN